MNISATKQQNQLKNKQNLSENENYSDFDKKRFKEICFLPSNNYNFFLEKIIEFCNFKKGLDIPHLNKFKEIELHYDREEKIFNEMDYKDCKLFSLVLNGSY